MKSFRAVNPVLLHRTKAFVSAESAQMAILSLKLSTPLIEMFGFFKINAKTLADRKFNENLPKKK